MIKYYRKTNNPQAITMFYIDYDSKKVDGLIEEYKTKDKISFQRNIFTFCFTDSKSNNFVNNLIESSVEIKKSEYDTAAAIINSMIDIEGFLIKEEKEVKLEPVYVD